MANTRNKGRRIKVSPRVSLRKSVVTDPRATIEVGRNDPCPCGSGDKYKNCCVKKGDHFLRQLAKKQAKEIKKEENKGKGLLARLGLKK
jgi:SEC-C motif